MAVVTTKATAITNRDATPQVLNNAILEGGIPREFVGTIEAGNGDSIGSKYLFGSIPSNARVSQILLSVDGGGTVGAGDIGLYDTTANGGAVVDADFFASAQSIVAALTNSDVTHESGVFGKEDVEKRVWEALGLASDPKKDYDVVMTLTTATDAAQTVSLRGKYVI